MTLYKNHISEFLEAIGENIMPYHKDIYNEFNEDFTNVVIVKSRQMGVTRLGMNVALFDLVGRERKFETVIHAFPRTEQARRYVSSRLMPVMSKKYTYLNTMLNDEWNSHRISDIKFKNENNYFTIGACGDADNLKGIASDLLIRDEVQDFTKDSISNTDFSLSVSEHPTVLDIGTPKDGHLKKLWNSSDKREYYYHCPECGEDFQPTIHLMHGDEDIACPACKVLFLRTRLCMDGKWKPKSDRKTKRIGFRLTRLIDPTVTLSEFKRMEKEYSKEKFKSEVLGEF
jgi:phage terminase large subunit GpA-like protein